MMDKMDPKMKEKMMAAAKKLGLDESMVDEHMMWAAKKMMFGLGKMMWMMKEKGMDKEKSKEIMKKMVDMMLEKDMMAKMEKMKEKWSK